MELSIQTIVILIILIIVLVIVAYFFTSHYSNGVNNLFDIGEKLLQ